MFSRAAVTLLTGTVRVCQRTTPVPALVPVPVPALVPVPVRWFADAEDAARPPFDASLLDLLVCPLSKKPLRYEASTNELINEELGIAYPIVDGIPNMIPQDARLIRTQDDASTAPEQQQ